MHKQLYLNPVQMQVDGELERSQLMWETAKDEMREVVWLASMVGGLSVLSVGAAVGLAVVL